MTAKAISHGARASRFLGRHAADVLLVAIAVAFSAHAVSLPYGHDQGLYHYVAREWVQRGAIPYRDVFDHKTPGIYLVYGAAIRLFGAHMWSIRVLEILCVLALGAVSAFLVTPRDASPPPALVGLGCAASAGFYYGFFNYWDTGQSEVWFVTLGLGSACAVVRSKTLTRGAVFGGLAGGAAILLKPPSVWFVFIAMGLLARRARREPESKAYPVARSLFAYSVAAASINVVMLGYFAAHGALGAMFDIVVRANGYYIAHESGVQSLADLWNISSTMLGAFGPVAWLLPPATVASLALALRRHDRDRVLRHGVALASVLAGVAALVMQKKFYSMHWVVLVGPAALAVTALAADALASGIAQRRPHVVRGALGVALGAAVWMSQSTQTGWLWENTVWLDMLTGKIDADQHAALFVIDDRFYSFGDVRRTGLWLRDHTQPAENVAVRGFNGEVYAVAERHYSGRFFWTPFLTYPSRLYRRDDYLREDEAVFIHDRPRYVVTMSEIHAGLDSAEWYVARGYRVVVVFGKLTVLEPSPEPPAAHGGGAEPPIPRDR